MLLMFLTGERLVVLSDGSLRLSQVKRSDAGTYSCLAQNAAGSTEGKTELILQGTSSTANTSFLKSALTLCTRTHFIIVCIIV